MEQELVFMNPKRIEDEPFTTSEAIAQCAGVTRHAVQSVMEQHRADFEEFGKVAFEMQPLPGSKTGQKVKVYHLNEQQATLAVTYLRNTPQVRAFKKELVRQFFLMRDKLATGMSAKQFREVHGIGKGESIRPYLTPEQAKMLDDLQRVDIGLLVAVPDFKERKEALTAYRDRRTALTSPTG